MPHTQPYSSSLYNLFYFFFLTKKIKEQRQSSISLSSILKIIKSRPHYRVGCSQSRGPGIKTKIYENQSLIGVRASPPILSTSFLHNWLYGGVIDQSLLSRKFTQQNRNEYSHSNNAQNVEENVKKNIYIYIFYVSKPVANYYYTPFVDG